MPFIFAILGYMVTKSVWGAFIGFVLGSLWRSENGKNQKKTNTFFQENNSSEFEIKLLSLCAVVIKADGKISAEELHFVRQKFVQLYGTEKANRLFQTFKEINQSQVSVQEIGFFMQRFVSFETRLQIIHFLFGIALSDGHIQDSELTKIQQIAYAFQISQHHFESIKAMFVKSTDNAYKILNISPNATDAEVKKAYREMAKKHHPDRIVTQDEAIKKDAEEKFKKIQEAYENIQKERGI